MKIYFELGKTDLPTDAQAQLAPLLAAAREQRHTWVISGYHDASGDAAANAELAKQRAFAVRGSDRRGRRASRNDRARQAGGRARRR